MSEQPTDVVLPFTADEVVDLLDKAFPEFSGDLHWNMEKFRFNAGQRSVVRYLLELRHRRDETLTESEIPDVFPQR